MYYRCEIGFMRLSSIYWALIADSCPLYSARQVGGMHFVVQCNTVRCAYAVAS